MFRREPSSPIIQRDQHDSRRIYKNKNVTRHQGTASNLIDFPEAHLQEFNKNSSIIDRKPNVGTTKLFGITHHPQRRPKEEQ
jgi:hypothetical protein